MGDTREKLLGNLRTRIYDQVKIEKSVQKYYILQ